MVDGVQEIALMYFSDGLLPVNAISVGFRCYFDIYFSLDLIGLIP